MIVDWRGIRLNNSPLLLVLNHNWNIGYQLFVFDYILVIYERADY